MQPEYHLRHIRGMGSSRLAQWGDVGTLNRGLRLMSQLEGSEAGTQASFGQIGAFHFYD
jgi:hypothetical protein